MFAPEERTSDATFPCKLRRAHYNQSPDVKRSPNLLYSIVMTICYCSVQFICVQKNSITICCVPVICQTLYKTSEVQTYLSSRSTFYYSKSCNVLKQLIELRMKCFRSTERKQLMLVCGYEKHNIRECYRGEDIADLEFER